MEEITYPDGEVLTYTYNAGGAVNRVSSVIGLGGSTVETTYVEDIGYDEYGQRTYIRYGNRLNGTPIETTYTYDVNRRWLTGLVTKRGMDTLQNITYQFDSMGNITNLVNDSDKYHLTQNYSYDGLYQLTEGAGLFTDKQYSSVGNNNRYIQNFNYDKVGNLLNKNSTNIIDTGSNGTNLNYSLAYTYNTNKPKQAKIIGNMWYLYDANGNTIEEREGGHSADGLNSIGDLGNEGEINTINRGIGIVRTQETSSNVYARTFEWDEENRLRSSVDPVHTVHYRYDSTGTRTNKYSSKETLYFSKMWLLTEDGTKFRESKNIYLGESRVATRLGFEDTSSVEYSRLNTYFYHADHLGSSNIVTDYVGVVYEHLEYTPFGETWINKTSDIQKLLPYKFTGQELDQETGLYYQGARYYNPKISRWMSSDPAGFELVNPKSENFSPIQSNNWYSYVSNNPVRFIDPTGLEGEEKNPFKRFFQYQKQKMKDHEQKTFREFEAWEKRDSQRTAKEKFAAKFTDPKPAADRMRINPLDPNSETQLVLVAAGTAPTLALPSSGFTLGKIGFKMGGGGQLQAFSTVTGRYVKLSRIQKTLININTSNKGQFSIGFVQGMASDMTGVDAPEAVTKSQSLGQTAGKVTNTLLNLLKGQ